jgi:predicted PurR-regulated permease PerM
MIIDPPNEKVRGWPVIGEKTYEVWSEASENLQATVMKYEPQVRAAGEWFLKAALGVGVGVLHFVASFIIAGILLMFGREGHNTMAAIAGRIVPGRGEELTNLMISTIRSVTNGVLGVAVIQAALAGIGFAFIGLPAAGVFTLVILVAAIIQVPALLIMLPLIGWVFSFASTGAAIVFAIYSIIVALSDNVLKPMLLGRGVDLPVLVVLIGAIGGMIRFGVIGLFLGAVILGLGYQIIRTWLASDYFDTGSQSSDEAGQPGSP